MVIPATKKVRMAINILGGPKRTAELLHVTATTVQNWLRKKNVPNIEKAKSLAELTGLSIFDLRSV